MLNRLQQYQGQGRGSVAPQQQGSGRGRGRNFPSQQSYSRTAQHQQPNKKVVPLVSGRSVSQPQAFTQRQTQPQSQSSRFQQTTQSSRFGQVSGQARSTSVDNSQRRQNYNNNAQGNPFHSSTSRPQQQSQPQLNLNPFLKNAHQQSQGNNFNNKFNQPTPFSNRVPNESSYSGRGQSRDNASSSGWSRFQGVTQSSMSSSGTFGYNQSNNSNISSGRESSPFDRSRNMSQSSQKQFNPFLQQVRQHPQSSIYAQDNQSSDMNSLNSFNSGKFNPFQSSTGFGSSTNPTPFGQNRSMSAPAVSQDFSKFTAKAKNVDLDDDANDGNIGQIDTHDEGLSSQAAEETSAVKETNAKTARKVRTNYKFPTFDEFENLQVSNITNLWKEHYQLGLIPLNPN